MTSGARTGLIVAIVAVVAIIGAFAFGLIDINQTREAHLPEVKTEGGQMPAFDVDTADVAVGTKTEKLELPEVKIDTTKEEIKLPTVDVKKTDE